MTTRAQIESWVPQGESETLEFKATSGERREGARAICAMLNHRGGRVLFGVVPDAGVRGQQVSERTIEEIAEEVGRIDPPAFPSIDRVPLDGDREVIVVTTMAGPVRPYSYKGTAY